MTNFLLSTLIIVLITNMGVLIWIFCYSRQRMGRLAARIRQIAEHLDIVIY